MKILLKRKRRKENRKRRKSKMGDRQIAKIKSIEYGMSFVCEMCGSVKYINIHHKDGNEANNNRDNLQILCRKCHFLEHPRNTQVEFICEYCGKSFIRYESRTVGIHKFCSYSCRARWYGERKKEERKKKK